MTRIFYRVHGSDVLRHTRLPFHKWVPGLDGPEARFRGRMCDVYVPLDCLPPKELDKIGGPPQEETEI